MMGVGKFLLAVAVTMASTASAYTVKPGDMIVRASVGPSVNVLRLDVATKATPASGIQLGVDFDYALDGAWAVASSLRGTFAPGFVDGNVGVGAKYRVLQLNAPFIPYASAQAIGAVGGPLGYGDIHTNVGVRVAAGMDYFVRRDLSVGLEVATEGSLLLTPLVQPEASVDALVAVGWRF
jgi:outer membrane protein W